MILMYGLVAGARYVFKHASHLVFSHLINNFYSFLSRDNLSVYAVIFAILDARQNLASVAILYQFTKVFLNIQGYLFLGHFKTTVICSFHSLLTDVWLLVFNIMQ